MTNLLTRLCLFFIKCLRREVVERRVYTVTGQKASADEVDRMIETGESESIFQKAILEQGRGHVRHWPLICCRAILSNA